MRTCCCFCAGLCLVTIGTEGLPIIVSIFSSKVKGNDMIKLCRFAYALRFGSQTYDTQRETLEESFSYTHELTTTDTVIACLIGVMHWRNDTRVMCGG